MSCPWMCRSIHLNYRTVAFQVILNLVFFTQVCEICIQFCITNIKPEALQCVWTRVFKRSPHACTTFSFEKEHVGEDLKKSPFLKIWSPPLLCISRLRDTGHHLWFTGTIWPRFGVVRWGCEKEGSAETHVCKELLIYEVDYSFKMS